MNISNGNIMKQQKKSTTHPAYWFKQITHDHIHFQEVVRGSHIKTIIDDPAAFDADVQSICSDYTYFGETIGEEGEASCLILARVLALDFIQVKSSAKSALIACYQQSYKNQKHRVFLYWVIEYLSDITDDDFTITLELIDGSGICKQSYTFRTAKIINVKQGCDIGGYLLHKSGSKPTILQVSFGVRNHYRLQKELNKIFPDHYSLNNMAELIQNEDIYLVNDPNLSRREIAKNILRVVAETGKDFFDLRWCAETIADPKYFGDTIWARKVFAKVVGDADDYHELFFCAESILEYLEDMSWAQLVTLQASEVAGCTINLLECSCFMLDSLSDSARSQDLFCLACDIAKDDFEFAWCAAHLHHYSYYDDLQWGNQALQQICNKSDDSKCLLLCVASIACRYASGDNDGSKKVVNYLMKTFGRESTQTKEPF